MAAEAWPDGRLDATTLASFAAYASAYDRWGAAERAINEVIKAEAGDVSAAWLVRKPTGTLAVAPLMQLARAAAIDTVKFASECGITAVARERTRIKPKIDPKSPGAEYFL